MEKEKNIEIEIWDDDTFYDDFLAKGILEVSKVKESEIELIEV